jgi:hypothetical protein
MKKHFLVTLALVLGLAGFAAAQAPAKVYVVHGIPGIDLGQPNNALPVDVVINDAIAIPNFQFGTVAGPVELPPGTYTVAIQLYDPAGQIGTPVIGPVNLPFEAGKIYTVIAHLTNGGDETAPTASLFTNDLGPTGPGNTRLIVHHTAWAPEVDVTVARDPYAPSYAKTPKLVVGGFENGDQAMADVRPGTWYVSLAPAGTGVTVIGPVAVELEPFTGYLVYAVGSLTNNTFTFIIKPIEGLKDNPPVKKMTPAQSQGPSRKVKR